MCAQSRSWFILSSEIWGIGVRTHVNSKGKVSSTEKILLRGGSNPRRCIKQDSEPNTLPTELFWPPRLRNNSRHLAYLLFHRNTQTSAAGPRQMATRWSVPQLRRNQSVYTIIIIIIMILFLKRFSMLNMLSCAVQCQ